MNIPFSPPDMSESEAREVYETILSGWITTGPKTIEFERQISEYCGTDSTVCLNSATAALELTLRMLGIGEGDEVIIPAYTYTASCSVICHVGATPVMVDVAKDSFEMDYSRLADAITDKTKAIIPVDIAGIVCDLDKIFAAIDSKKALFIPANDIQKKIGRIAVISDCAHGFGAEWKGKKAGTIADFTCFSFHAVKNLTTAEGGAVTWNPALELDDDEFYRGFQIYSLHGQTKSALIKNQPGAWEYDIIGPYYKCNMTDIMASIGLAQLKRYDAMLARRHEIIKKYDAAFKAAGIKVLSHTSENHRSSGHLYLTRIEGADVNMRNEIIVKMAEAGIACNVHYKPLPMLTAYKNLGFDINDYPNAYAQYENEITIPLYSRLTDEQVDYIIENFVRIVGEYK